MGNQKDNWGFVSATILIAALIIAGCGTSKNVKQVRQTVEEAYEIQKPINVRTSKDDKRPDWTKLTTFEDGGNVYFSGGFLNGADYALTIRCANAEALKVASQSISQFIRSEFSSFVQGSNTGVNDVERHVEDGIATFARSLHIQGIRQKEVYYEEMFMPSVMTSTFNVWVQLEISKADYMKAKAEIIQKLHDKFKAAGEIEAKEKAEKLLEELKDEVRSSA